MTGTAHVKSVRQRFAFTSLLSAALIGSALTAGTAPAGEVRLKNGTILTGTISPVETIVPGPHKKTDPDAIRAFPIQLIATPLQRYFVPVRQCDDINKELGLPRGEVFKLPQANMAGKVRKIGAVGSFVEKPRPFDAFGRRSVKLRDKAMVLDIVQGIRQISPDVIKIEALNFDWETAMPTSAFPFEVLDPILRKTGQSDDSAHRLKVARFYIQAAMYKPAKQELEALRKDFPDLEETTRQVEAALADAMAQELVGELKLRRRAGQHQFVYEASKAFPVENVPPAVLREAREITAEYDDAAEKGRRAIALLGELQAQLSSDPRVKEIGPIRAEIAEKLNIESLERLDAFLKLADDDKLPPDDKLALALSGWVLGSQNAITELNQALRFWQAREFLLDYLRLPADEGQQREQLLQQVQALEGLSVERVAQILPQLPPALDASAAVPGRPVRIEVTAAKADNPVAYWVLLPPEYHPDHRYPLIVALHAAQRDPAAELSFWGGTDERPGQSQRHGYVVIAPEFAGPRDQRYEYKTAAHRIVLESLRDARKRFHIDSDRVFLSGHDMGGDATFDIGLSHPDQFAGVIPINGVSDRHCQFYWENGGQLPLYVIGGQLSSDIVMRNSRDLMRMFQHNFNLIYTEYEGAGAESFYSEIHKLFDWMSRLRRAKMPERFEAKVLRETDNHFYWFEFEGLPEAVAAGDWFGDKRRAPRPMKISCDAVRNGSSIIISSGAARNRVLLSPDAGLIDFDKRLTIRLNGRQKTNDFPEPNLTTMLERLRYDGDRQRLVWAVIDL